MEWHTGIGEVGGVVGGVWDRSWLRLIELLVFDFLELHHCDGVM